MSDSHRDFDMDIDIRTGTNGPDRFEPNIDLINDIGPQRERIFGRDGADSFHWADVSYAGVSGPVAPGIDSTIYGGPGNDIVWVSVFVELGEPDDGPMLPPEMLSGLTFNGGPGFDYFLLELGLTGSNGSVDLDISKLGGTFRSTDFFAVKVSLAEVTSADAQNSYIRGHKGNDLIEVRHLPRTATEETSSSPLQVSTGAGNDVVVALLNVETSIRTGVGDDVVLLNWQTEPTEIRTGRGADQVRLDPRASDADHIVTKTGRAEDLVEAHGAFGTVRLGADNDTFVARFIANGTVFGDRGDDVFDFRDMSENDKNGFHLVGGAGSDQYALSDDVTINIADFVSGEDTLNLVGLSDRTVDVFATEAEWAPRDRKVSLIEETSQVFFGDRLIVDLNGADISIDDFVTTDLPQLVVQTSFGDGAIFF